MDHSFFVINILCLSFFLVFSLQPYGHRPGTDLPLGLLVCEVLLFLSLSHVVSWVRYGA